MFLCVTHREKRSFADISSHAACPCVHLHNIKDRTERKRTNLKYSALQKYRATNIFNLWSVDIKDIKLKFYMIIE